MKDNATIRLESEPITIKIKGKGIFGFLRLKSKREPQDDIFSGVPYTPKRR